MKKLIVAILAVTVVGASLAVGLPVLAKSARMSSIRLSANRVVELQRTDADWEGTWYWYVGSDYNATNLTGATALGLLEAYRDTKKEVYLDAAIDAANFIMTHLGAGATGTKHHARTTAPDIVFLHRLSDVTGNSAYSNRAVLEWNNIKSFWPTAASLDSKFRSINRPSTWDIAFFLEAAYLSDDSAWADDAAAILADTTDGFYYNQASWWYALNLAGSIRALVDNGYAAKTYKDESIYLLGALVSLSDKENGIDGWVQDTAYGVLAFRSVGGVGHQYANELARWLSKKREENGGWNEGGSEYPEVDGEALRAIASTVGKNVTFEGWKGPKSLSSSWRKAAQSERAKPFK